MTVHPPIGLFRRASDWPTGGRGATRAALEVQAAAQAVVSLDPALGVMHNAQERLGVGG
jgi:hypothetical protein